jgi:predicted phosphodiesterase
VRVAIISDAHLFQNFVENYNSVKDLERALNQIKTETNPSLLFLAGDMFDYMKTETAYLRHYEGEGFMVEIRDIFRKFGNPIYAIRGNHDKEEILRGLEQTVDNFHYPTGAVNFDGFSVCFMSSFYETGGYGPATLARMESFLKEATTEMKAWENRSVLLCHETLAPYDNALPRSLIRAIERSFDVVLDGHMHFWNPSTYNSNRIICLPSLLPSKIAKGKYASERYVLSSEDKNPERLALKAPFGYVVLDTGTLTAELCEFLPTKKTVEVVIEGTDLQLEDVRSRLRNMLSELDARSDRNDLIVLPVLQGQVSFSRLFLENVKDEFPNLVVQSIRDESKPVVALTGGLVSAPTLSIEQVMDRILLDVPSLVGELRKKGVDVDQGTLRTVLTELLTNELLARSQTIPQTATKLRMILEPVIRVTTKSKSGMPSTFEDNLVSLLKRVR